MGKTQLAPAPVVIVTGANGGVGYGICQRLLLQLCQLNPPDSQPQSFAYNVLSKDQAPAGYSGVTLIMACRNMKRAEAARAKLLRWFNNHLDELKRRSTDAGVDEYTRTFLTSCDVQIAELDLASFSSVLKFAAGIRQKVPYVSHLVFNAGVASFTGIDWLPCFKQLATSPMAAITAPEYYLQRVGEISADNLGWVWQSNVFGHFTLFRELEHLLAKSPLEGAKVLWCSSLEASPKFYDSDDWQLIRTEHSYESSKYQIDLIANCLDEFARSSLVSAGQTARPIKPIRHFVTEPGVCSTTISRALAGPLLDYVKILAFYIGRLFGSQHHTIDPLNAAIAVVHLMLIPLAFIPLSMNTSSSSNSKRSNKSNQPIEPIRFGAQTNRWGEPHIGLTPVKEWNANKEEGVALVRKCDALYKEMKKAEFEPKVFETASERM